MAKKNIQRILSIGIRVAVATNKERIENVEKTIGGLQESFNNLKHGMLKKMRQLEIMIGKTANNLLAKHEPSLGEGSSLMGLKYWQVMEGSRESMEGNVPKFLSKLARLEFPQFSKDDPTEWFTRVEQFFEYQKTPEIQQVALASYHLEGEANTWW